MDVELRHLRYFVAVAEAQSFSRAATRLRITQPALSRQVRDLEVELGVRLFERAGRQVTLTGEGDDLLRRSRELLAGAEALGERARAFQGGAAGILRLGATPQTLQSLLARFLVGYRRAWPGVDVRLTEDGGVELLGRVERGELNLAIGQMPPDESLRGRPLFPLQVLAVMAHGHRLGRRSTIEASELAREPLLLLRRGFGTRDIFDGACRLSHAHPRIVLESGDVQCLVALAESGHGIAMLPSTVRFGDSRVRIVPVVQGGRALGMMTAIVWNPRRFLPPYGERFVEAIVAYTRRSYPGKRFVQRVRPVE
jgi:DNA-binding transcriptional LysR family regulator